MSIHRPGERAARRERLRFGVSIAQNEMQVCSNGATIRILHLRLIVARMVAGHAIPNIDVASSDSIISRLGGIHRHLHNIGGLADPASVDGLVADVIAIVGERYIVVVQSRKITR